MCHEANIGVMKALTEGVATSTTVLMPCPWVPEIVDFIEKKGKTEAEEMQKELGLSLQQLRRALATLRHMEILRGFREEGRVYYTFFEKNRETD